MERGPLVPSSREAEQEAVPDERRILTILGEARRKGRWIVPRLLRVRAYFGDVKIDLRDNPIPADFTFDVGAFAASVTLIVPPGVNVVFDVFALMGNATSQADEPSHGDTRAQWIRVGGSVVMGEVKVLVRERDT
ncbi:MAG: cell wall-active antibiotics response protein [Gemmatimonadota bacterium]|nr:cell wall-active antibiotics response protein [Gemmatimonadota bacterium]